jgi:hypothetical protein
MFAKLLIFLALLVALFATTSEAYFLGGWYSPWLYSGWGLGYGWGLGWGGWGGLWGR